MCPACSNALEGNAAGYNSRPCHCFGVSAITTLPVIVGAKAHCLAIGSQGTGVAFAAHHRAIGGRAAIVNQDWSPLVCCVACAKLVRPAQPWDRSKAAVQFRVALQDNDCCKLRPYSTNAYLPTG